MKTILNFFKKKQPEIKDQPALKLPQIGKRYCRKEDGVKMPPVKSFSKDKKFIIFEGIKKVFEVRTFWGKFE